MGDKFVLQHRGKQYDVERGRPASQASTGGGAPGGPELWYITLGGTAITNLEHQPGETEPLLRARIVQWLDQHQDLQGRDQIHLGGG